MCQFCWTTSSANKYYVPLKKWFLCWRVSVVKKIFVFSHILRIFGFYFIWEVQLVDNLFNETTFETLHWNKTYFDYWFRFKHHTERYRNCLKVNAVFANGVIISTRNPSLPRFRELIPKYWALLWEKGVNISIFVD